MSLRKRTRTIFAILISLLVVAALLWLATPLWFPWILPSFAKKLHAQYSAYENVPGRGFTLRGVRYQDRSVLVTADRVQAPLPNLWLWAHAFSSKMTEPPIRVSGWTVTTLPSTNAEDKNDLSGKNTPLPQTLQKIANWIPAAILTNGDLRLGGIQVHAPDLIWSNATVTGRVFVQDKGPILISAQPDTRTNIVANLRSEFLQLNGHLRAGFVGAMTEFELTGQCFSNTLSAAATFTKGVSLPLTAAFTATNLNLSAAALGLPYYGKIAGQLSARWQTNSFLVDTDLRSEPLPDSTNLPPIHLTLHGRGDTNSVFVETAAIRSPWVNADLSRQLQVYFSGPLLRQPAFLKVSADLARQPWIQATGQLDGEVQFEPGPKRFPLARFSVRAREIHYAGFDVKTIKGAGTFDWPTLALSTLVSELEDGTVLNAAGGVDLQNKVAQPGHFELTGPLVKRWLPPGYNYEWLQATADFSGPFSQLAHSGALTAKGILVPQLRPLDLEVVWKGTQTNLDSFELVAKMPASSITITGSLRMQNSELALDLQKFVLETNQQPALTLQSPTQLKMALGKVGQISVSPLQLSGPAGKLTLNGTVVWPELGNLQIEAQNIVPTELASAFLTNTLPELKIQTLTFSGGWSNGPLTAQTSAGLTGHAPGEKWKSLLLAIEFQAIAGASGIIVSNLVVNSQTSTVVNAHGTLPLTIVPASTESLFKLETNQPIAFTASTGPDAFFWQQIARLTHVLLKSPRANVQLSGTWLEPLGTVNVRAEEIKLPNSSTNLPSLKNLELELELDHQQARLTSGQILVAGQRVSFLAELPLDDAFWGRVMHKQIPDRQTASAHLQIQDAEIAAFSPLYPSLLAPQGELSADIVLRRGGHFDGELSLSHARTRPLGNSGPFRDVTLNVRLHDRKIELRNAHASLGGATITMSGQLDLTGDEWLHGQEPPFALSMHGVNVPLARQPEYIVRSDLLLGIIKTNRAPPLITGTAKLHDCYYLSDLRALIPGKVASPTVRPPYFSIDDPLIADWRLAVDVQGTRFMKLRSPLFNGEISSNVKLLGTLKDPIALGDVKIDSGFVRFPFASLQVQQGMVNLTSQDPYRPQISVRAQSKQFGYDIRMEVSGSVDAPMIQFNSTPPLGSEQILLMVSAGELPQGTFSLSPQQRAQTVALFLGRDLLSKLGIGDQGEQRLNIRTGEEISEQGRPTYQVDYKLTDRWSVTGEYDRFGDYNAGVKWRVYSK